VWVRERRDTRLTIQRVIELAKSDPKHPYDALRRWVSGGSGGSRGSSGGPRSAKATTD
jgi:hypothetical protein